MPTGDAFISDPFLAWVAFHANGDWEHSFGFKIELRGNGEFFANLHLGDTLLHGLSLPNVRISPRCRGWSERSVLCARGHIEESREASAWYWTVLTSEMENAIDWAAAFLTGAGRDVELRISGPSNTDDSILFELLALFTKNCGVSTLDEMVTMSMDDDLTCVLSSPKSPDRLRSLSKESAHGWTIRFAPQMAGELLEKFKQVVM